MFLSYCVCVNDIKHSLPHLSFCVLLVLNCLFPHLIAVCSIHSADPDEEDAKTILQQFSMQRYMRLHSTGTKSYFCLQLIRPENKRHLVTAADGAESSDLVACLNEIKMGVIAKAVMFPVSVLILFESCLWFVFKS